MRRAKHPVRFNNVRGLPPEERSRSVTCADGRHPPIISLPHCALLPEAPAWLTAAARVVVK
jgi:hypothetical protein